MSVALTMGDLLSEEEFSREASTEIWCEDQWRVQASSGGMKGSAMTSSGRFTGRSTRDLGVV